MFDLEADSRLSAVFLEIRLFGFLDALCQNWIVSFLKTSFSDFFVILAVFVV